jgi:hypothetical protein
MTIEAVPRLAVIVGAARSGTTLLRLILDSHPEIGCPPEAGIPGLMAHMAAVWMTINADERGGNRRLVGHGADADKLPASRLGEQATASPAANSASNGTRLELPNDAREWVRTAVSAAMTRYCAASGKRVYVDKSLDSVQHLRVVRVVEPETRYILVFRHVMDTIASGIEASPWGFNAYGYAPYVQASPGNLVAALGNYWLRHVEQALAWEQEHPEMCHRVRYEDLVRGPEAVVADVCSFLGVGTDTDALSRTFDRAPSRGPGDYKVAYTNRVHQASLGRGKRVPVTMLPPPLLEALNEQLGALGYPTLKDTWNTEERLVDSGEGGSWAVRLRELMSGARVVGSEGLDSFAIVAEDIRSLRWVVEPADRSITQGDGDVGAVLTGTAKDLALWLGREENIGALLRTGRIRHLIPGDEDEPGERVRELHSLLTMVEA